MTHRGGFTQGLKTSGDFDDVTSPSSRIVLGKLSGVGRGNFDVLVGGLEGVQ
ncbi:hypothetical protein L873DRAFT_1816353 [Choiromyces venosus 120613-1]|uniref:Uncharacterized protein n=1 Tax=Choiromyces venosus 120613-1 TaxID=1336337 RepID=A0A3N4J9V6_9PEZI|nr:hypothetical protein L873DRAFT_1823830 [Choiromyces venosus 120613-1]RPA93240.1 hypothetical protein L873DRAFT_1816353 [Choiromyces venosus 120613-1]